MTFQNISTIIALVFFTLCLTLIFAPDVLYWLFQIDQEPSADFLAKRAGMLFLGLSVICFLARKTTNPEVISFVCAGVSTAMLGLAVLGIYELIYGIAGYGILVAILTECIIGAALFRVWKQAETI
ncbi:hypothetical protein [Algirhabdus cladophorae]|uniref:hypothetical protein n=1 Tax=Algirhabdus cladophorae TaxID=3377108 RepID=UPI003B8456AA